MSHVCMSTKAFTKILKQLDIIIYLIQTFEPFVGPRSVQGLQSKQLRINTPPIMNVFLFFFLFCTRKCYQEPCVWRWTWSNVHIIVSLFHPRNWTRVSVLAMPYTFKWKLMNISVTDKIDCITLYTFKNIKKNLDQPVGYINILTGLK